MSTISKKAILKTLVEGAITELMVKTEVDNVYVDETTPLSSKLAEMVTAINLRAKSSDVTSEINSAVSTAISNIINDAPETYDTLKEIADYIASNDDVVASINAAIGNKADKSTVTAIQTVINGLGSLATKSKIAESDLETELATKINNAAGSNHSHSNKSILDGITSSKVSSWDGKSKIYASTSLPSGLAAGDMWIQLTN